VIHKGGCQCGAVSYEVEAPADLEVSECNCSICSKSGYLHLIVPRTRFRLLTGEDNLETYTFGTHQAQHLFCKTCGIKSFYIPRSHPDGFSVNVRCLDHATVKSVKVEPFDGQNWEESIKQRKPLDQ
jgi:hypothetical protein